MMYGEFVEHTGVYVSIDEYCPLGHYANTLDNSINEYWEKTAEKHILNKKPTTLKSSGRIKLNRKIEITCLPNTAAKLLVFSELAKLISNF